MCDMVFVMAAIDAGAKEGLTGREVEKQIRKLVDSVGLGFTKREDSYIRHAVARMSKVSPKAGDAVFFDLESRPNETCICDALPGGAVDSSSANQPLARLFRALLESPLPSFVTVYVGPVWVAQSDSIERCPVFAEVAEEFMQHFVTDRFRDFTGMGEGALYLVRRS